MRGEKELLALRENDELRSEYENWRNDPRTRRYIEMALQAHRPMAPAAGIDSFALAHAGQVQMHTFVETLLSLSEIGSSEPVAETWGVEEEEKKEKPNG